MRWLRLLLTALVLSLSCCPAGYCTTVVRIGLLMGHSSLGLKSPGELLILSQERQTLGRSSGQVTALPQADGIQIGGHTYPGTSILVAPVAGYMSVDGHPYRGLMQLHLSSSSTLDVINWLDLEDYVSGVVGGEIPSSWPLEALKAQAVACRSYALAKMQQTRTALYDLVNTDRDQVYEGMSSERPSILQAVKETRGQVLMFGGNVIKAYFSACCGGHTEDGGVVFGEQASYLKGVEDPYCAESPYEHWDREYTVQQLKKALMGGSLENLGQILSVEAASRTPSGRVEMLAVKLERGEHDVPGIDLRRILGYRELRSTRFDVKVAQSIPIYYQVEEGPDRTVTTVSYIPETIEVGFEETQVRWGAIKIDRLMQIMDVRGKLAKHKPSECFALQASSEGKKAVAVPIKHGVYLEGLEKVVAITRFDVKIREEKTVDKGRKTVTVEKRIPVLLLFTGAGWGHGVGMCQWGCRGMAKQGFEYADILKHYYPGTALAKLKD